MIFRLRPRDGLEFRFGLCHDSVMFTESVPYRDSPPAVLARESYCDEADKSQKRTLANLSKLA